MVTIAALLLSATFTRTLERVSTMDPAMATTVYDSHAVQLVYEPPLEIDYRSRPYKLIPGFCELPEVSEDGLTYTFKVKVEGQGQQRKVSFRGFRGRYRLSWTAADGKTVSKLVDVN